MNSFTTQPPGGSTDKAETKKERKETRHKQDEASDNKGAEPSKEVCLHNNISGGMD